MHNNILDPNPEKSQCPLSSDLCMLEGGAYASVSQRACWLGAQTDMWVSVRVHVFYTKWQSEQETRNIGQIAIYTPG